MNNNPKLLYQIALTQIFGVGDIRARQLLEGIGDEEYIFRCSRKDLLSIKGIAKNLVDEIKNPEVLKKAETELLFIEKNKIQTFFFSDNDYPTRLKDCLDAPILLYYKGNADLNSKKVVSIVGTRKSTNYGDGFCEQFIDDISKAYPDLLIVSGLAYGIDIQAHKSALKYHLSTVGVLAHGLDRIYPSVHRKTAVEMLEHGGLLTEFVSGTEPERYNFVRRNRIVAGMADAVLVLESDKKGGSLITADIANSYNKEVFSLPGRIVDIHSAGCNQLIVDNKAVLLQSVDSFLKQMNWDTDKKKSKPKQQKLFLDLSAPEQLIYNILFTTEHMHVNMLSAQSEIQISLLFPTLLDMEMKGIIESLPGGLYKIK